MLSCKFPAPAPNPLSASPGLGLNCSERFLCRIKGNIARAIDRPCAILALEQTPRGIPAEHSACRNAGDQLSEHDFLDGPDLWVRREEANSVAVADVNGDGKLDLVVTNDGSSNVSVLLGNGDGTFKAAVSYNSGGQGAGSVEVADVNGDSKLDLVVANDGSSNVSVLLGNGDGTFQAAVSYNSGGQGSAVFVAVADVNGDSKPDICSWRTRCTGRMHYPR